MTLPRRSTTIPDHEPAFSRSAIPEPLRVQRPAGTGRILANAHLADRLLTASILPLRLEGAELRRRGVRLFGPVDLEIGREGATVVIGPNGSGKTSLLRLMHGLERPTRGRVKWSAPANEARTRQAYVFQTPIAMRRRVVDNIAYPLLVHGVGRAEARRRAAEWAAKVGLGDMLERPAPVLSGGEKQKLALARALIRDPEILFLDEPCANLDGRATREIEAILAAARGAGARIVMATHDMGQARRIATEILFLLHGRLHEAARGADPLDRLATPEAQAFLKGDIVE